MPPILSIILQKIVKLINLCVLIEWKFSNNGTFKSNATHKIPTSQRYELKNDRVFGTNWCLDPEVLLASFIVLFTWVSKPNFSTLVPFELVVQRLWYQDRVCGPSSIHGSDVDHSRAGAVGNGFGRTQTKLCNRQPITPPIKPSTSPPVSEKNIGMNS